MGRVPSIRSAAPVAAAAFLLRPLITSLPPAMAQVRADLGMPPAVAGLTVGLPVVCFGAFAFAAPFLVSRMGIRRTMTVALVVLALGALVRPAGSVGALLLGTIGIGMGCALGNVLVPVIIRRRARPQAVPRFMGYYTVVVAVGASLGSLLTGPLLDRGVSWNAVLFGWGVVSALVAAT